MIRTRYAVFLLLGLGMLMLSSFNRRTGDPVIQQQGLRRIIIDPGHDISSSPGGHGNYCLEREVVLAVGLELEKVLHRILPDVEVVLTRRTNNVAQSVIEKSKIANQAKGDLFISLHTNDIKRVQHKEFTGNYIKQSYYKGKGKKKKLVTTKVKEYRYWSTPSPAVGTETFIYNIKDTESRKRAAMTQAEAYVDSLEALDAKAFQEAAKKNDDGPLKGMLANMMTEQYFSRSAKLAGEIQQQFVGIGRVNRSSKQRPEGIYVLHTVSMPAVLIELGFISNPEEEDYLNSDTGRQEMAEAIGRAVVAYRNSIQKQISGGQAGSGQKK